VVDGAEFWEERVAACGGVGGALECDGLDGGGRA